MFEIINLLYSGFLLVANINMYSVAEYPTMDTPETRDSVVAVSFYREWWRADGEGKCTYEGIKVPYVRDWSITTRIRGEEHVIPPEPNKTAGDAILINRRVCKGKSPEAMLYLGEPPRKWGKFIKNTLVHVGDTKDMKSEHFPKWYNQVIQRVTRVAATDDTARQFLADTEATRQALPAVPDASVEANSGTSSETQTSTSSSPVASEPETNAAVQAAGDVQAQNTN